MSRQSTTRRINSSDFGQFKQVRLTSGGKRLRFRALVADISEGRATLRTKTKQGWATLKATAKRFTTLKTVGDYLLSEYGLRRGQRVICEDNVAGVSMLAKIEDAGKFNLVVRCSETGQRLRINPENVIAEHSKT